VVVKSGKTFFKGDVRIFDWWIVPAERYFKEVKVLLIIEYADKKSGHMCSHGVL